MSHEFGIVEVGVTLDSPLITRDSRLRTCLVDGYVADTSEATDELCE